VNVTTDVRKQPTVETEVDKPPYETPRLTVMEDEEVLKAFQMTALEISAAGCWWSASSWG
jgi:hypothetical protein